MNTNISYSNATNGTVNLLSSSNASTKQTNNLIDDFSNIFGNPTAGQNAAPAQNNFANLFSIDSNPVMPNINEPVKGVKTQGNQFDLLSGFLNLDANTNQAASGNNMGLNMGNNANAGFNLLGVNTASSSAPAANTNDLLSSLGLVSFFNLILYEKEHI